VINDTQNNGLGETLMGVAVPKSLQGWKPADHLHIERVEGGFLINGCASGKNIKAVAHNETKLVSMLRKWVGAGDLAAESEAEQ